MRRCGWLATVVLLSGCTIRSNEPVKEMPKFGSSAQFATTAGFVEGTWRKFLDESTARRKSLPFERAILSTFSEELAFTRDGKAVFLFERNKVNGHWVANGNGIDLTFDDVDGVSAKMVNEKYDVYRSRSRFYRNMHEGDFRRGSALGLATLIKRLELHEDKKRLFEPTPSTRSDGSTFMGTPTWLRE